MDQFQEPAISTRLPGRQLGLPHENFCSPKSFRTATQTIAGYKVMVMIRQGQVAIAPASDMKAQSDFIAALFSVAA
ncbi:hypothetical protein [Microvirga tunisiensis]|uniref:hypothetical protein n=1 Tax=Microvirga tunisiensis TaxID=2108360 RepID=UPI0018657DDA|nr:hypothetical protein [Microvirga tunisiensis]